MASQGGASYDANVSALGPHGFLLEERHCLLVNIDGVRVVIGIFQEIDGRYFAALDRCRNLDIAIKSVLDAAVIGPVFILGGSCSGRASGRWRRAGRCRSWASRTILAQRHRRHNRLGVLMAQY